MNRRHPDMRPMRWLAHLPLAVLPFLAAVTIEGPWLEPLLLARVRAALVAEGQAWVRLKADGRDIEIRGEAPGHADLERARRVAVAIFGVRRVTVHAGTAGP